MRVQLTVVGCRLRVVNCGLLVVALLLLGLSTNAQVVNTQPYRAETRAGNKEFNKDNYTDAEANYKKALDKKNNMPEATFNLGDAVYKQKRYDEAIKQFQLAAQTNPDPKVKAKAFHNLGNTYMEQEKWQDAANAYKSALKLNPADADTKYNLAYANAKLQQQKNDQKNKDQNKDKDKKDQQKKDDQQQKKDDQKNKDQQKKDQQQQDKNDKGNQQQKQGQQPKLSKEEAEKLLQALTNEEQKTNQKVQQKQVKAVPIKIQKDW